MMEVAMTIAKTLLAVIVAGLGAVALYAEGGADGGYGGGAGRVSEHYPGVGLGTLLQPLEH